MRGEILIAPTIHTIQKEKNVQNRNEIALLLLSLPSARQLLLLLCICMRWSTVSFQFHWFVYHGLNTIIPNRRSFVASTRTYKYTTTESLSLLLFHSMLKAAVVVSVDVGTSQSNCVFFFFFFIIIIIIWSSTSGWLPFRKMLSTCNDLIWFPLHCFPS